MGECRPAAQADAAAKLSPKQFTYNKSALQDMSEIIKRNGKRERFEAYKVQQAIEKAYHASQEEYNPLVYANVLDALKKEGTDKAEALEKACGKYGRFDVAVKKIDPREE